MKNILLIAFCALSIALFSCKKAKEEVKTETVTRMPDTTNVPTSRTYEQPEFETPLLNEFVSKAEIFLAEADLAISKNDENAKMKALKNANYLLEESKEFLKKAPDAEKPKYEKYINDITERYNKLQK